MHPTRQAIGICMAYSPESWCHTPAYAELHCLSNFTFLRGASHPEELVKRAVELGYAALAITDECSLAGVVRAHVVAKQYKLPLIIGSEFCLQDGLRFVLLATDRSSYGRLSSLITHGRRHAKKGQYRLERKDVEHYAGSGCLALWLPTFHQQQDGDEQPTQQELLWLAGQFPQRTWIAVENLLTGDQAQRMRILQRLGEHVGVPLCASGDVHMHLRSRKIVQDTLCAIREGRPLSEMGYRLQSNSEQHLRDRATLAQRYPSVLMQQTIEVARQCCFSLDELRYQYPKELVPDDHSPQSWLRKLSLQGLQQRWPDGAPEKVRHSLERELTLVHELAYEAYFLTVYDIVRYAKSQGILCQGRGSAANSVICYCLGITEVDPSRMDLLFERFISKERNEPPDIDVDFEHERREQVIQYIYRKYGRQRAALTATVITYQPRSAIRDVGKALGMTLDQVDRLAKSNQWWDGGRLVPERLQELGFAADSGTLKQLSHLVASLLGFPRHLSQHVGGFVISQEELSQLVPIENAAMAKRTVIQWEKNDLEALGLLKVDVLALGMLSAIRKALALISDYSGKTLRMQDIPAEDPRVYDLICKADTVGVFQIESRAQMSMLPRLKPRNYYDLVIQIAIVRPGPIQGDMVHPFLMRRSGREAVSYPSEAVKKVLQRTLGIPIFQEQVMQLAMVAAGFNAGEADQLRRSMAAWKRKGGLEPYEDKLIQGMQARGYAPAFAQQIFRQIKGFGDYGFPESHSASFALLAYVSSWLKCYHPAAFTCALLNSQPMGFYAPAQLVQDAQRHGVCVQPVDVCFSEYDCTLEIKDDEAAPQQLALRLGLRMIKGLSQVAATRIVTARHAQSFAQVQDLVTRAQLNRNDKTALAAAGALQTLSGHRHRAGWQISGTERPVDMLPPVEEQQADVILTPPSEGQDIIADYASTSVSLGRHPLALLRKRLASRGVRTASELWQVRNGAIARVAGIVIGRQRPGTATGVVFVTLEDETGHTNVVVWASVVEQQRKALLKARLLEVSGIVQQEEGVLHLIAGKLTDLSGYLGELQTHSRDFH